MNPIETPRLTLRDFVVEDWKAVQEYARDAEVVRYLPWGPNPEGRTVDFVRACAEESRAPHRREFNLAIVLKEGTRLIGGVRITVQRPEHREADFGYVVNRGSWGKGYATEASRAVLEFGFATLGVHRIYATCDPANVPSHRVLEKCGLRREGHLRENLWMKGDWRDSVVYAMLHQDWKHVKEAGL